MVPEDRLNTGKNGMSVSTSIAPMLSVHGAKAVEFYKAAFGAIERDATSFSTEWKAIRGIQGFNDQGSAIHDE